MTAVWPDCSATTTPGVTVRDQLDYLVWIAEAIEPVGFHATDEVESWRPRIDRAYLALIDSMVPGHGDPLPPDVPPSVRPGTWPDVPSATRPGMTVRHQLTVIRTVSDACRANRTFPHQPGDVATWAGRVQTAYDALDHGPALAMPAAARTQPPPPPPPKKPLKKKGAEARSASAGAGAKSPRPHPVASGATKVAQGARKGTAKGARKAAAKAGAPKAKAKSKPSAARAASKPGASRKPKAPLKRVKAGGKAKPKRKG